VVVSLLDRLPNENDSTTTDFSESEEPLPAPAPPSPPLKHHFHRATQAYLVDDRANHRAHEEGFSFADISENTNDKATQVHLHQNQKPSNASEQPLKSVNLAEVSSSDSKLFTFTGIHSLDMLDALVKCASDIDTDSAFSKKALRLRDRIILTMIRIKMNISFTAIAIFLGIGRQS